MEPGVPTYRAKIVADDGAAQGMFDLELLSAELVFAISPLANTTPEEVVASTIAALGVRDWMHVKSITQEDSRRERQ